MSKDILHCTGWLCGSTNLIKVDEHIEEHKTGHEDSKLVALKCQDCGRIAWDYAQFYEEKE